MRASGSGKIVEYATPFDEMRRVRESKAEAAIGKRVGENAPDFHVLRILDAESLHVRDFLQCLDTEASGTRNASLPSPKKLRTHCRRPPHALLLSSYL